MNTQVLEFIIDNQFETLHDAIEFYNTFGPQKIDDNLDHWKSEIASRIDQLHSRGQLQAVIDILNKKCLYNNELGQFAKAYAHNIKFESFKADVFKAGRDAEMAELIRLVG